MVEIILWKQTGGRAFPSPFSTNAAQGRCRLEVEVRGKERSRLVSPCGVARKMQVQSRSRNDLDLELEKERPVT